jgi:hypothetical protein
MKFIMPGAGSCPKESNGYFVTFNYCFKKFVLVTLL